MNLDTTLLIACSLAEAAVIALLIYRRVWRLFPIFFTYSVWTLLGGAAALAILRSTSPSSKFYLSAYLAFMLIDAVLLFAVLDELAWSVLRPLRTSLPRKAIVIVSLIIIVAGALIWPFATVPNLARLSHQLAIMVRLKETVSALAVLAFVVLAGGSQFLSIGWRDRELQIATGLGLYSVTGLVVTVLHTYPSMQTHYNSLDTVVVASYLCSLIYWIVSFRQQEQERRELSPQAQNLLLAMAGAAKTARVGLVDSSKQNSSQR